MQKILLLNGSPRHDGNTRSVLQCFNDAFVQKNARIDLCDLYTMSIEPCLNCDSCKTHQGQCFLNDDTNILLDKIETADTIIFGSPVYWWGISAKLKLLIDKFYARDSYFKTLDKKIGVVAIGANSLSDKQYALIKEQFSCIADYLNWSLKFYLPLSAYTAGEIMNDPQITQTIQRIVEKI